MGTECPAGGQQRAGASAAHPPLTRVDITAVGSGFGDKAPVSWGLTQRAQVGGLEVQGQFRVWRQPPSAFVCGVFLLRGSLVRWVRGTLGPLRYEDPGPMLGDPTFLTSFPLPSAIPWGGHDSAHESGDTHIHTTSTGGRATMKSGGSGQRERKGLSWQSL